jgi:hypothetical protein
VTYQPAVPPLTPATRLQAPATVLWREMRGGLVVLDTVTGRYFHLAGSSAILWRLIEQHRRFESVIETAAAQHGLAASAVQGDAYDFIESAIAQHLLETETDSAGPSPVGGEEQPALQVGRSALTMNGRVEALQVELDRQPYIYLADFIEPSLLAVVERAVRAETFVDRTHAGIGKEQCLGAGIATSALQLLFNDPALLDVVGRIAGCEPIRCCDGRVYRMLAGAGHYDSWHSDAGKDRAVGVSVNLSPTPYEGGTLEIRHAASTTVDYMVPRVSFGSAVMFRISPTLRHRVSAVDGSHPRTAYAGWFCLSPDFQDALFATLERF